MNFGNNNNTKADSTQCEVCSGNLNQHYSSNHQAPVCHNFQCKQLYNQRFTMESALYKPHFEFQKKILLERKAREEQEKQHIAHVQATEASSNQSILNEIVNQDKNLDPEKIHMVMIPSGITKSSQLSAERKELYRSHLDCIIKEAKQYANADEATMDQHHAAHDHLQKQQEFLRSNPEINDVSNQLCCLCKGGCCSIGENHAFISAVTIRRQLDKDPTLTSDSILNSYMSYLNNETLENSCVNQTTSGCVLPTEMRSDVCNVYFCDEVKKHQKSMFEECYDAISTTLVVQRCNTNWNRYETTDFNKVTSVAVIEGKHIRNINTSTLLSGSITNDKTDR